MGPVIFSSLTSAQIVLSSFCVRQLPDYTFCCVTQTDAPPRWQRKTFSFRPHYFHPYLWPQWWVHTVGSICHFLFLNQRRQHMNVIERGPMVVHSRSHGTVNLILPWFKGFAMIEWLHNRLPLWSRLQDIACGKINGTEQPRQTKRRQTQDREITMFRCGEVKWTREKEQSRGLGLHWHQAPQPGNSPA